MQAVTKQINQPRVDNTQPPYDGSQIPEHFRSIPYDDLPEGIKAKIVQVPKPKATL
jgi:hypothetical protein